MKNVFGFNLRTGVYDGEKFIVRRAEGDVAAKQEKLAQERLAFMRFSSLPKWVNVCGMIMLFLGLIFLCGVLEGLSEVSFKQAWENANWCFIVSGVCLVGAAAIFTAAAVKARRAYAAPAYRSLSELTQKVAKESYAALGVPESAAELDIISYAYNAKEGKPYKERGWNTEYENTAVKAYRENETLCLAYLECVLAFPLSRISSIQCIGKRIAVTGWNKQERVRKGRYGSCKIGKDSAGRFIIKPYYRMTVRDEQGEEYAILLPCYEAETILSLTGGTVG